MHRLSVKNNDVVQCYIHIGFKFYYVQRKVKKLPRITQAELVNGPDSATDRARTTVSNAKAKT